MIVEFHTFGCDRFPPPVGVTPATARGASAPGCGGFVLRLPHDLVLMTDGQGTMTHRTPMEPLQGQHPAQYMGAPFGGRAVIKFYNAFLLRTPPGYSTLFVPVVGRLDFPLFPLPGVVETDGYYQQVHFPSVSWMWPGSRVEMKAGTPLVQAVPMKREAWTGVVLQADAPREKGEGETRRIEFRPVGGVSGVPNTSGAPQAAVRCVPEWLKRMATQVQTTDTGVRDTMKRCAPLMDAVTNGYVATLPGDVVLEVDPWGKLACRAEGVSAEVVAGSAGHGLNFPLVRLTLPWRVTTPEGYMTVLYHPVAGYGSPVQVLSDIIDSDADGGAGLTVVAMCLARPGETVRLAKGMPIAHLMPVERRAWQGEVRETDDGEHNKQAHALRANPHLYREEFWVKKEYT